VICNPLDNSLSYVEAVRERIWDKVSRVVWQLTGVLHLLQWTHVELGLGTLRPFWLGSCSSWGLVMHGHTDLNQHNANENQSSQEGASCAIGIWQFGELFCSPQIHSLQPVWNRWVKQHYLKNVLHTSLMHQFSKLEMFVISQLTWESWHLTQGELISIEEMLKASLQCFFFGQNFCFGKNHCLPTSTSFLHCGLTSSQIWLIPLVDDHQSIYLTIFFKNPAQWTFHLLLCSWDVFLNAG
jgi:hypothetical protein